MSFTQARSTATSTTLATSNGVHLDPTIKKNKYDEKAAELVNAVKALVPAVKGKVYHPTTDVNNVYIKVDAQIKKYEAKEANDSEREKAVHLISKEIVAVMSGNANLSELKKKFLPFLAIIEEVGHLAADLMLTYHNEKEQKHQQIDSEKQSLLSDNALLRNELATLKGKLSNIDEQKKSATDIQRELDEERKKTAFLSGKLEVLQQNMPKSMQPPLGRAKSLNDSGIMNASTFLDTSMTDAKRLEQSFSSRRTGPAMYVKPKIEQDAFECLAGLLGKLHGNKDIGRTRATAINTLVQFAKSTDAEDADQGLIAGLVLDWILGQSTIEMNIMNLNLEFKNKASMKLMYTLGEIMKTAKETDRESKPAIDRDMNLIGNLKRIQEAFYAKNFVIEDTEENRKHPELAQQKQRDRQDAYRVCEDYLPPSLTDSEVKPGLLCKNYFRDLLVHLTTQCKKHQRTSAQLNGTISGIPGLPRPSVPPQSTMKKPL